MRGACSHHQSYKVKIVLVAMIIILQMLRKDLRDRHEACSCSWRVLVPG